MDAADGEACDDGDHEDETACPYGTLSCLGCSADCAHVLSLSGPHCGDGTVDAGSGEACDDGNNVSGDGCRGDCSKVEACNDFVRDEGELCDGDDMVETCESLGFAAGGVLGCSPACTRTS